MSTYSRSTVPLVAVRAKPQSWPMRWQNPDESAASLAGCTVTARISWRNATRYSLSGGSGITITNEAGGLFTLAATADQFAALPEGLMSEISVQILDASGESHVFDYPLEGRIA